MIIPTCMKDRIRMVRKHPWVLALRSTRPQESPINYKSVQAIHRGHIYGCKKCKAEVFVDLASPLHFTMAGLNSLALKALKDGDLHLTWFVA